MNRKGKRTTGKTKLKRALGLWELVFTGIGIILGAGIYVIIGPAAGMAGNALWCSFLIAAIVSLFTGLSYAELSSRMPKAGGEYVYTERAFNKRLAFIVGWLMVVSGIIAASTVSLGFSGYLNAFFNTDVVLTSILLLFFLSMILIYGVKESAWFGIVCSLIEAGGLVIIILFGLPYFGSVDYLEFPDVTGLLSAAALVFFAFLGFEEMVNMAEEVKEPVKTMPKAIILAIVITTLLYILVAVSSVSVLGWEKLSASQAPLADVAWVFFGDVSHTLLGIIGLFATANTVLLVLLGTSRLVYGMAEGGMLPKSLASVHKSRRTPWVAIISLMIISMLFVLIGNIKTVASLTNATILLVFIVINLSVIVIRYKERSSRAAEHRFFMTPVNMRWFPVIPFLGFLTCLVLLVNIELKLVFFSALLAVPGLVLYELLKK